MASTLENSNPETPDFADRPASMTAAAFLGIAWYLCIDLNVRLFMRATRHSLYFWSCLLCSWGLLIHGIAILLANFNKWTDYSAIVFIHFSWVTFVVAQSCVLYSRLNLLLKDITKRRCVLYMILINSVIFGLTTILLGMIARHPRFTARLKNPNLIWDKVQVTAFFIQETLIGILYIYETWKYLKNSELLRHCRRTTQKDLRNLIAINVLIILLDCSVLGLCYGGYFFLQGFYKVAVYAIKLRTEFTILNQLQRTLTGNSTAGSGFAPQGEQQRPIAMVPYKPSNMVEAIA